MVIPRRIRRLVDKLENFADIKKEFHPEPNVKNHLGQVTTLAIQSSDDFELCYAALLHDIAKNKNEPRAWAQHAFRGSLMIASDVTPKIRWLVENHMKPYDYKSGKMRPHKRQALKEHKWFEELMTLNQWDDAGRKADGVHAPWEDIYTALDGMDNRENCAIIMIGIQAVGKSTISRAIVDASRDFGNWHKAAFERTSKDDIRLVLGIGPGQWRHQEPLAREVQQSHVRMALGRGQGIIIDNCHNTIKRRREALEWLKEEFPGIRVEAHLVYAPLEVCIQRNKDEHGQPHRHKLLIPSDVLRQFHGDLSSGFNGKLGSDESITKQLEKEGFDSVAITRTA
jgi:predicted kinase